VDSCPGRLALSSGAELDDLVNRDQKLVQMVAVLIDHEVKFYVVTDRQKASVKLIHLSVSPRALAATAAR
jgi:hypothetical protein